jgi:hypothetical protein
MKSRLKLGTAVLAAAAIVVGLAGSPASAATSSAPATKAATGTTTAFLTYSGITLHASGNTVGWARGTITVHAMLFSGSSLEWDRSNTCTNSTSCTVPSFIICPRPGTVWELYVYGRRGTQEDNDYKWLAVPAFAPNKTPAPARAIPSGHVPAR